MARPTALLLLVVAWVLTWRPALDPDLWWHLELGREVIATGRIPTIEPWSWWTAGAPFLAHSWGWDVLVALAFDAGGVLGVSLLGLAVSGTAVLLLWALLGLTRPALPVVARSLVVVAAVLTAVVAWSPRAQAIDLVAVLAVAVAWRSYLATGRGHVLVALPVIAVLWANLHGSAAPTGLVATLAALGLATGLMKAPAGDGDPGPPLRPLALASVVAMLGLAVNPAGVALLQYPTDPSLASAFHPAIQEWRPPDLVALGHLPFTAALAAGVLALIVPSVRKRLLEEPLPLLLAAGWTAAALVAARFVLLAGPLLVAAVAPAILAALLDARVRPPGPASATSRPAWLLVGLAAILVMGAGATLIAPSTQQRLIEARFPVAVVDRMIRSGCDGRLLNAYDWGGYLLHRGLSVGAYGNSRGFVVDVQAGLEAGALDPAETLDALEVDLALVPSAGPLAGWLGADPGWRVAIDDGQALLAVRAGDTGCQML